MRYLTAFFIVLLSCNSAGDNTAETDSSSTTTTPTISTGGKLVDTTPKDTGTIKPTPEDTATDDRPVYANARFKDVRVQKLGGYRFEITGRAQIFEASFSWYVEDGHEEIKSGHSMTDAGAPEWGDFSFTVRVKKKRPNSTLHLVLYESSAKDGSRQYELPVLLY